jgi:hypothetical protein
MPSSGNQEDGCRWPAMLMAPNQKRKIVHFSFPNVEKIDAAYIGVVESETISMTPELVTRAVQERSFPRVLYKYRQVDKYTKSIFERRQLWFAHLDSFNDPFDCQIHDEGSYTTQELMDYLTNGGMDPIEASSIVLRNARNPGFSKAPCGMQKRQSWRNGAFCACRGGATIFSCGPIIVHPTQVSF